MHKSFLYKREKAMGDKVYWTCRDHTLHGCRSRAITQGQRVTVMRGHSHLPDLEGLEARRQQEKAMEMLLARPGGPGSQVDKLRRGVDSLFYRWGPGALTLTRPQPRKREKVKDQGLPAQPEALQDEDLGESSRLLWSCCRRPWKVGDHGTELLLPTPIASRISPRRP